MLGDCPPIIPASRERAQLGGLTRHPLIPLTDLSGRKQRPAVYPENGIEERRLMTKRLVALFGAAAIVLGACQPASPTTAPNGSPGSSQAATESQGTGGTVDPNGVLREYLADTDPPSMNPTAANDSESIAVQAAVYRGLMYYDKDLN